MLYSDNYLLRRIKVQSDTAGGVYKVFATVHQLWQLAQENGDAWSEEETEKNFVQPVLSILSWSFAVQVKHRELGEVTHPDYTLFLDEMSRAMGENAGEGSPGYYKRALAIAEAKHWCRPLDLRGDNNRDTWKGSSNPAHQMIGYLKASGLSWGVLTNGQVWRLYHYKPASHSTVEFYEINLDHIFSAVEPGKFPGDREMAQFTIWYYLFHRNAFVPDGSGLSFTARLRDDFLTYQIAIKDRLTDRLIENAFPVIARSILLYRYQNYGPGSDARINIKDLTAASVNLLYRMLFLFVAEYQGMMPGNRQGDQLYGICSLAESVLNRRVDSHGIYDTLIQLFHSIYFGDMERFIPPYRGTLFDPRGTDSNLLVKSMISDADMIQIFTALTIDGKYVVDYQVIDSLVLADISNTLLNVELDFIALPMERRELKASLPSVVDVESIKVSDVGFVYPTANYLVYQALHQHIESCTKAFSNAMDEIITLQRKGSEHNRSDRHFQDLSTANAAAIDAVLGLKILDPAMNTGSCLLSVISYLADEIISLMQVYHDVHPDVPWEWNPVYMVLEQERKRSQARLSRYGLDVDIAEFGDTRLLKRLIALRCIFGVENDPLRVILSRHNLWLMTFSIGTPFSFLDHHIRLGNVLLGALVRDDFNQASGIIGAYLADGATAALSNVRSPMSELRAGRWSVEDIRTYEHTMVPYKTMLNLTIQGSLGQIEARELLNRHSDKLENLAEDSKAKKLTDEHSFFLWDIEFHEIFLDPSCKHNVEVCGFDAIISVPRIRGLPKPVSVESEFLKQQFPLIYNRTHPNWLYFAQALRLLAPQGIMVMVIENKAYVTKKGPLDDVLARLLQT
ncbi:MAG: hypothetical protein P1S60_11480 [Anaerolineae bacterium]|nr:hypothetical protein [Anaerolineae bacterium]